jgi:hypothetical protein
MAGIITVSPYIGIRPTELITIRVIQAELEMVAGEDDDDDDAIVGLGRSSLGFVESLAPFSYYSEVITYKHESYVLDRRFQYGKCFVNMA